MLRESVRFVRKFKGTGRCVCWDSLSRKQGSGGYKLPPVVV